MSDAPRLRPPAICIGCGGDHPGGAGCGYDRDVVWTAYGTRERLAHVRFFPVVAGLAAATLAAYLVARPPATAWVLYAGVAIGVGIAAVVGGLGAHAMIAELRKRRWRAASVDGRDRALVAVVSGRVEYAFGEAVHYEPVTWLDRASELDSAGAVAAGAGALRDQIDDRWLGRLRDAAEAPDLLSGELDQDETLAFHAAAAVFGLAARGDVMLSTSRYRAWSVGGAKMKKVSRTTELAVAVAASAPAPTLAFEARIVGAVRSLGSGDGPVAIGDVAQALAEERITAAGDGGDAEAALRAWRWLLDEDGELVCRMLESTLLVDDADVRLVSPSPPSPP